MQPGDHVVLVKDDWSPRVKRGLYLKNTFPITGVVYTVRDSARSPKDDSLWIRLAEIRNPILYWPGSGTIDELFFLASRFRKLSRLSPESFRLTKEPTNV